MNLMRCSDCGDDKFEPNLSGPIGRADICPKCYNLRKKLLDAMKSGNILITEFQKVQKAIAGSNGSGRGARAMRKLLKGINVI